MVTARHRPAWGIRVPLLPKLVPFHCCPATRPLRSVSLQPPPCGVCSDTLHGVTSFSFTFHGNKNPKWYNHGKTSSVSEISSEKGSKQHFQGSFNLFSAPPALNEDDVSGTALLPGQALPRMPHGPFHCLLAWHVGDGTGDTAQPGAAPSLSPPRSQTSFARGPQAPQAAPALCPSGRLCRRVQQQHLLTAAPVSLDLLLKINRGNYYLCEKYCEHSSSLKI